MAGKQYQDEAILELLLERIQKGEVSIDLALEQFPEQASELRPLLEAALWLQESSREFEPPMEFNLTTRHQLISRIIKTNKLKPNRIRKSKPE